MCEKGLRANSLQGLQRNSCQTGKTQCSAGPLIYDNQEIRIRWSAVAMSGIHILFYHIRIRICHTMCPLMC